jgi:glycosyltransferase involved in cell wall biosynthesis
VNEYEALPSAGSFKRRWNIGDKRIILFLGRLHWIKGADIVLEAFRDLGGATNDIQLVFAGPDDGQEAELKKKVRQWALDAKVTFTGFCDHQAKLEAFVDSDVTVVPSRSEVFAITAIEALASGCPVLLSDVCGLHPMPSSAQGVLQFQSERVDDLATKLRQLIGNPSWRVAAQSGRQFVMSEFGNTKIGERAERIYRQVLSKVAG